MAQVELKYTIPYQSGSPSQNGAIVDIILTYDENTVAGNVGGVNYYRATAATGTYKVLGAGNTVLRTDTITGISPVGTVSGNDNYIRPSVDPIIQSGGGLSYTVNVPTDGGNRDGTTNVYRQGNTLLDGGSNSQDATDVSSSSVCFAAGTLIRTVRGDIAVENLAVGDLAINSSGKARPIRWIGHRTMDLRGHARPKEVMPVRIAAGALGENRPARDLLVSPGHSLCLDVDGEVLIPAIALVNGATVTQDDVETVTYWHVELDGHDLLIAEGQPAESYLDMGNRGFFAESGVVSLGARPDADAAARSHADFCRPFHGEGAVVEAAHARLQARAETLGWTRVEPEIWADVHLKVDGRTVRPKTRGLSACFVLPADARDVWLVSPAGGQVGGQVGDDAEGGALGLCLSRLSLNDGLGGATAVALDDPLLRLGFHAMAKDHRWTTARAQLPAALWAGLEGQVFLRLDLLATAAPRWIAPGAVVTTLEAPANRALTLAAA